MRPGSVAVSVMAHAAILLAAVIVPLLATADLPEIRNSLSAVMHAYVPGVVPPPPPAPPVPITRRVPNPYAAPIVAPTGIKDEVPLPRVPPGPVAPFGVESDTFSGVPVDFGPGGSNTFTPPPPPLPRPPAPVRVSRLVEAPARIVYAPPVYPTIAQHSGVEGIVILEATIDIDGRVQGLKVLRSHPLLDRAAIDAVQQWRYTPTKLNGVPVPVIMTVTVSFRLNR